MIFNILSRLVGGIVLDRVSFKLYLGIIITLSTILSLTYPTISQKDFIFGVYLALSYFISGSIFGVMPIFFANIFGPEIGS